MKRKLIKQGLGGYTIYLPKKWVDQRNLNSGDEVEINIEDGRLMIDSLLKHKKAESTVMILSPFKSLTRALVINQYRLGFDKIIIKYDDKSVEKTIKSIIAEDILGFEIITQSQGATVIESLTEPSIDHFDNLINKHFFILKEIAALTRSVISKRDKAVFQQINELVLKLNQHANFLRRCISKKLFSNRVAPSYWLFLSNLALVSREFKLISDYAAKNKIKLNSDVSLLLSAIDKLIDTLHNLYLKKDLKLMQDIFMLQDKYSFGCGEKMLDSKKANHKTAIHYLINIIRQLYHASSPLGIIISN